jgi:hypothetical protein
MKAWTPLVGDKVCIRKGAFVESPSCCWEVPRDFEVVVVNTARTKKTGEVDPDALVFWHGRDGGEHSTALCFVSQPLSPIEHLARLAEEE